MHDITDTLYLFNQSPFHLNYSLAEFNAYAVHPYLQNHSVLVRAGDEPIGFASWVLLTPNEGNLLLADKFSWPTAIHYRNDPDKYDIWCIELLAPNGGLRQTKKELFAKVKEQYGPCKGYFRRSYKPQMKKKWTIL